MALQEPVHTSGISIYGRLGRFILKTLLGIFILLLLVILLVQTPYVQNIAREKAQSYLANKLKTRVEIGKLYIGFPQTVELSNVYIEDLKKDTLLSGGSLNVNINMWKLLHSEIAINTIALTNITAKVKRQLPDTSFNFQFIVDAFASDKTKSAAEKKDKAALKMSLNNLLLDKVRLVYNDIVTGDDMEVWIDHSKTNISKIDPSRLQFDIPLVEMKGLRVRIYQDKPLQTPQPKTMVAQNQPASPLQLAFKQILLQDIVLDYRNNVSALYSNINLGELKGKVKLFDMEKQLIELNSLELNKTTTSIRIGKQTTREALSKKAATIPDSANNGWRLAAGNISLAGNSFQFDDDSKPRQRYGMDYSHLKTGNLSLQLNDLLYNKDSISGRIKKAAMHEQSGFVLNQLQANFLYANNQAYLKDLLIQTPGTTLRRSVTISYPSLEILKKNMDQLVMDIDLRNSRIQLKDILSFAPTLRSQPIFKNPNAVWQLNSRMTGSLSNLRIQTFQFSGLQETKIDLSGTAQHLTDIKNINANLFVKNISSSSTDLRSLLPVKTLPSNITIPAHFNINGSINGDMNKVTANLSLHSTSGDATVKGSAQQFTDKKNALYDLAITTNRLDLGNILQDTTLGSVSASINAKGRGYDPKYANATVKAVVRSATIKKYNYQNFLLKGSIANQQFKANASMQDPNIYFELDASGDISSQYASIRLHMNIDSIKTLPLHLTADNIFYRGAISADFPVTNPDSLEGNLSITKSLLVRNDLRVPMDTILLASGKSDSGQFIHLTSDAINIQLYGKYRLKQMGTVFQQAVEPYFATKTDSSLVKADPYDFTISGEIINKPVLKVFLPGLAQLNPVTVKSHFTSTNGWNAFVDAPLIINDSNKISNLQLQAGTHQDKLNVYASFAQMTSGSSLNIYATNLQAAIANNKIDFSITSKDKNAKNKYRLTGLLQQPQQKVYVFSLKPDSILLNYEAWNINRDNKITVANNGINVNHFELSKEGQLLSLNSQLPTPDAPVDVNFKNFRLSTLTAFVQPDSLLAVNGTLDGKAVVSDILKQPGFTSDLVLNNFSMNNDTLGTVHVKVNNTVANTFAADININGRGNDVQLTGNYYIKPANNNNFDLTLDVRKLELKTLQGVSKQMIRDASGNINGKLSITGNLQSPAINGDLNFNKTRFNLGLLNSYFSIDQEKLAFTKEGILFDTFTVYDSAGNKAVLNGTANTSDFRHYRFDLTLRARDFHALNTTKKNNKIYYGQLYFNTNLSIKGTEAAPIVDGSITINDKTKLTMVLPQKEPGVEEREGIVRFVSMGAAPDDSLLMAPYDSLNRSTSILGMDVNVNIEIKKEAELSLVIDEGNGDFINVRGEALLNAGIDQSGKITLTGSYELQDGSYQLTFNFLKRKFNIQKGSKLIWKGEPTEAEVAITAVYIAETAPLDLVESQLEGSTTSIRNTYRQKLPFEVDLKMKGRLLKPDISFDIILPDNKNYNVSKAIIETVDEKLDELRKEPSELNKQVFALLLLNRFVSENPFQSSTGITAESFARASVSKIFTEQLNQLATDLIKGVDVNFDVVSQDDYTTGDRQSKTDLNVALSKRLLNDRLTVTVGSNFELEGAQNTGQQATNIAGNIALDYQLSKDGRYLLRAYRKNDYQGVLEGYIIETGIGFIITVDYNKFKEIFQSKKDRERKRAQRKAEKEKETPPVVKDATTTKK